MARTSNSVSAILAAAGSIAIANSAAGALVVSEQQSDSGVLTVYKMTVTPAAEPVPALRHRLVLRDSEYKPGNAAVHYLRSFPEGGDVHQKFLKIQKDFGGDDVYGSKGGPGWYSLEMPLDKLDREKLRRAASCFDGTIDSFVRPASDRLDCDWGHSQAFEQQGTAVYAYILSEVQTMRAMSRAIMLKTRSAVAERQYDEAIDLLRMNYRLGENVGKSPFLVSSLVGLAVAGVGNAEVVELIAANDSPNLYWALAELPQPLVDVRRAIRAERALVLRAFPVLSEAETAEHSPEEWVRLVAKSYAEGVGTLGPGPQLGETAAPFAAAGLALATYPDAKRRLIAAGMDAGAVERMSVGQTLAIDAAREFRRIADALEKWDYVPVRVVRDRKGYDDASLFRGDKYAVGFGGMIARLTLPAVQAARQAVERFAWQLGGIRTVEAVRMHVAATGRLPKSLDEVTVVPLPENPATGRPYAYRLDGETAVIDLPYEDGFNGVAQRFEVRLAE